MSQNAASWSDVRRIILHESFASTVPASIFTTAAANNYLDVKISKTLHADFVLPECQPTCAFILIHTDTLHTDGIAHYIPRLEKLQSSFRNTYCVLLTHNTDIENETWVDLNLTCPVGRLRLLMVHSLKEFEDVVLGIFQTMTQSNE